MKITETPCFAIKANDRIDLNLNASCFYEVLRVRELPGMQVELLVRATPQANGLTFQPKYITRNYNDTLAKLEETES